jgi:ATP synthase protein I
MSKAERTFNAFSTASVGLEMGVAVVIGLGIGYYLDREFATQPALTLVGLGVGVAAGFKALFRVARQAKRMAGESNGPDDSDAGGDASGDDPARPSSPPRPSSNDE